MAELPKNRLNSASNLPRTSRRHFNHNDNLLIVEAADRCKESGTNTLYIELGAPWQNGIVESFNSRLREELFWSEIFTILAEAQLLCERWRANYIHRRPQREQGKQTPFEYEAKYEVSKERRLVQRMETTENTRRTASIMSAATS